ncbi:MAG: hypothetical protein JWM71_11, partial [Solirubrobacteraceae bacterium]|nr:hypothetical protein [Solirubrobacteraceae bacterium]
MAAASSSSAGARSAAKLGVVMLIAAGVFGIAPLYVTGITFLVLGVGCIAWVASGARGVQVSRVLGAARVVEGEPLSVRILVSGSRVALPSCEVQDPMLDGPVAVRGGRRTATLSVDSRFDRRGRRRLNPPVAIVRDPLGLARRVIVGDHFDEVLVLPRVEPIVMAPDGSGESGTVTRRARPGIAPSAEVDL